MANVLVDTDVFIDHLRGAHPLQPAEGLHYSVVTRCELFAGRHVDEVHLRQLLDPLIELPVTRTIAENAGRLRRELRIQTPDALIAATALEHGLELTTRNARDFARVPGLALQPPA